MKLRITAGELKNRSVATLDSLRPMMDKVRKALFDILGERVLDASFLDLFAGSGAVGIEALSRGADRAVFIDKERAHYNLIKKNLDTLNISDRGAVRMMLVEDFIEANQYPYDIVVAAPWYKDVIDITAYEKLLAENGILVIEHESKQESPVSDKLKVIDKKRYGETALTFYTHA